MQVLELFDANTHPVTREAQPLNDDCHAVTKGHYRHFMLKEIFEQSKVLADTLEGRATSLEVVRAMLWPTLDYGRGVASSEFFSWKRSGASWEFPNSV